MLDNFRNESAGINETAYGESSNSISTDLCNAQARKALETLELLSITIMELRP